jgi:hypothetical protein
LGEELLFLIGYVEELALKKEEKETLINSIESCRSSLFEYLNCVITHTYEEMNLIENEEKKWK